MLVTQKFAKLAAVCDFALRRVNLLAQITYVCWRKVFCKTWVLAHKRKQVNRHCMLEGQNFFVQVAILFLRTKCLLLLFFRGEKCYPCRKIFCIVWRLFLRWLSGTFCVVISFVILTFFCWLTFNCYLNVYALFENRVMFHCNFLGH